MSEKKSYWWFVVLGILFFVLIVMIVVLQDYYAPTPPFSNGLYESAITGRIKNIYEEKDKIEVRLLSDSLYYFVPLMITKPQRLDFPEVVHRNDSLWKFQNSNVIYSCSPDGRIYKWTFVIHDRFSRIYPDSSAVDSSLYINP